MSSDEASDVFSLLSKPIREAVVKRGFKKPTEPQREAIPLILQGKNVLLIAPTATGKTEAALLPIFSLYVASGERDPGIKILYITPLRALNRDLLERLEWWGGELDIKVAVRHGDTEVSERAMQAKAPPDMLITTPETLQAVLSGRLMRRHLSQVRWVIVDEVHELAEDKRGSQLSLGLERLRWVAGREFQVVGLSATIGSPELVARFLVGVGRPVEVVKVPVARLMKLQVFFPQTASEDYELAGKLYTHPEVASRLRFIRGLMDRHRSILLFVNTRAIAEVLASRFHVWDLSFPVSIHHGSLSKPSRVAAEKGLKTGGLKGLVCTSSLELGIDVGRVDLVIQYMSPRQVTRLVQRVGRSGHRVGLMAKGVIVTADPDDTLEAMVICGRAFKEDLEPVEVPDKPYDVLCHQLIGILMQRKKWYFNQIIELFTKAYPYKALTEDDLKKVIEYMHTRYPRLAWGDYTDKILLMPRNRKPSYEYFFSELSMIPDEKRYIVIDASSDTPVGVLDEAFVAEYGEVGTKFVFRGSLWKIRDIMGDRIYVNPVSDPTGAIPSWVGEEIPVPYEVAQEVGFIKGYVEGRLREGFKLEDVVKELCDRYLVDADTLTRALREVYEQFKGGYPVPTDRRVVVEPWEDFMVIHAHIGTLPNRALARLLGDKISGKTGRAVGIQQDPYRVVLQTFGEVGPEEVKEVLGEMDDEDVASNLRKVAERCGLFKRRIVHVARRFGALAKWTDFSSISLRRLIESFKGTVIYEEAMKEFLTRDVEVPKFLEFLRNLKEGRIELAALSPENPTPITRLALERISRKTELIPPEKMRKILIEAAKARLLNETRVFACTSCWRWEALIKILELPERLKCPRCGSMKVALLDEDEDVVKKLCMKEGKRLTKEEEGLYEKAVETAALIDRYGKAAAITLAGRGIRPRDAEEVLSEVNVICDGLFMKIVEAEREALRRRFW